MKIVSWNCKFGYDVDRQAKLLERCPGSDVYVIQECKKTDFDVVKNTWKYKNWYSDDLNDEKSKLGVAVFSNTCVIEFTSQFNRMYRYVIPYRVSKDQETIILFAVWTKKAPIEYDKNVIGAVSSDEYRQLLSGKAVVIGDFNTGANKFREERYSLLTSEMGKHGFINAAKDTTNEFIATFYGKYHDNEEENYFTNDFCFVSHIPETKCTVNVLNEWDGDRKWQGLSDHCPIMVNIAVTA